MAAYTNVGQYYYKTAVEGESHTLVVDTVGDNVTITYDGSVIHTIPMGDTGWSIPLFLTEYVPNASNAPLLFSLSYMIEGVSNSGVLNKTPYINGYSLHGDYNSSNISLPHTFNISGTAITGMNNITLTSYMADTGDLVLAESPVIDPEQYIYTSQCFQLASPTPVDDVITIKYVMIDASGTSETIGTGKKSYTESDGTSVAGADYDWTTYKYNGTAWKYKDWYNCDSADDGLVTSEITVRTTSTEDGLRLNGIDAVIHWDGQPTDTITLTKFVVPVEVGGGPSPEPSGSAVENVTLFTYAGWSTFRKAQLTNAEITNGAVDLTDAFGKYTMVTEILGIQSDIYASFDFDPKTQKLRLYTATNTPASGTATVIILALVS